MKWIVNSKYIDGIIVYSANEVKFYEDIFKCRKGLFHYVQLGKGDESKTLKNEKGDYIISVGRSNRDYDFLVSSLKDTKYKLVIVSDAFSGKTSYSNVKVLTSCYENEMLELIAKSFCVVVPLLNPKISAGQLVVLQGQNLHKPVIATDSEGVKNYIQDGKTGFLIPKNKNELLRVLAKLEDDILYKEIAENAYHSFMDNFSVSKQFKNIGSIVNTYMM